MLAIISPLLSFADDKNTGTSTDGRFQLVQLSNMRRDQFLLDTKTGKVWNNQCIVAGPNSGDCNYAVFLLMDVEGITGSVREIFKKAADIKNANNPQEQKN